MAKATIKNEGGNVGIRNMRVATIYHAARLQTTERLETLSTQKGETMLLLSHEDLARLVGAASESVIRSLMDYHDR